ncbi:MAG: class I SAM-dependent methyltransferase [Pseudomonadota bacterium]
MADMPCPVCGDSSLSSALRIENAPAHTVVVYKTAHSARAAAVGTIDLSACNACGFVFNRAFDATRLHYTHDYEATQSFSATFNSFHEALAADIAQSASAYEGAVLEIGCGQGEFLALLEDAGCGDGIGFDPAFDPARSSLPASSSISIRATTFDPTGSFPPISAIVCKMTLEHIADPVTLLSQMAGLSRKNSACPVYIMVPNGEDVFVRRAFWDVYYEHCNYFTRASLNLAMQIAGLNPVETKTVYSDQYLLCCGQASQNDFQTIEGPQTTAPNDAHGLESELDRFHQFRSDVATVRGFWQEQLKAWAAQQERIVLWGGGSKAVGFLTLMGVEQESGSGSGLNDPIVGLIDINPRKRNSYLPVCAKKVVLPSDWQRLSPTRIVLMNSAYQGEVAGLCTDIGLDVPIECVDAR